MGEMEWCFGLGMERSKWRSGVARILESGELVYFVGGSRIQDAGLRYCDET